MRFELNSSGFEIKYTKKIITSTIKLYLSLASVITFT
jgi:hypothetical protein